MARRAERARGRGPGRRSKPLHERPARASLGASARTRRGRLRPRRRLRLFALRRGARLPRAGGRSRRPHARGRREPRGRPLPAHRFLRALRHEQDRPESTLPRRRGRPRARRRLRFRRARTPGRRPARWPRSAGRDPRRRPVQRRPRQEPVGAERRWPGALDASRPRHGGAHARGRGLHRMPRHRHGRGRRHGAIEHGRGLWRRRASHRFPEGQPRTSDHGLGHLRIDQARRSAAPS